MSLRDPLVALRQMRDHERETMWAVVTSDLPTLAAQLDQITAAS